MRFIETEIQPWPSVTTNRACYDASRMPALRDLFWHPFSSTSTLLNCQYRLQKVCSHWRSSNHACWWRIPSSGGSVLQKHGNCRWIPPDLEAKAQHCKKVSAVFHPNTKEPKRELNITSTTKLRLFAPSLNTSEKYWTRRSLIADTSSHFAKSWHHRSHSWGRLLALTGVLGQQRCEQPP